MHLGMIVCCVHICDIQISKPLSLPNAIKWLWEVIDLWGQLRTLIFLFPEITLRRLFVLIAKKV